MGLVTRDTGLGFVVAEEAADEAQLSRALREIDRDLVLQKERADVGGGWVYKVVQIVSDDYAPVVFVWCDRQGNPLPLSSGLVEEFKGLRKEAASRRGPDADERNRRLVERTRQQIETDRETVIAEHRPRVEKGRMGIGMSTRGKRHYRDSDRRLK